MCAIAVKMIEFPNHSFKELDCCAALLSLLPNEKTQPLLLKALQGLVDMVKGS